MATRTWSSASSTDMNDGANYSGAGALLAADDLVFNGTSVVNATATAGLSVNSISVAVAYTGAFSDGAQAFTIAGAVGIASGGAVTCTGTWTQTGDANFVLTSSTAWTTTSWIVILQGTGALQNNSGAARSLNTISAAASGKTTTQNGTASFDCVKWTLGAGGWVNSRSLVVYPAAGSDLTLHASHTLTGTQSLSIAPTVAMTLNLPGINGAGFTGTFIFRNSYSSTVIFSQQGNIVVGGAVQATKGSNGTTTWNTNNYSFTCAAFLTGNNHATNSLTINMGSTAFDIANFESTSLNVGTTAFNMGSSAWTVSGSITFGTNTTVTPGTSAVTIDAASTITSAGESFYDLTVNAAGATVATADDLAVGDDLILTAGTLNISGDDITIGGDLTLAAAATFTIDATSTLTFTGVATIATGGKTLPQTTINGNTAVNAGCTITRLIWGTDGKTITWQAGQTFTISNLTAANWNGAAGSLNALRSSVPGTQFTLALPNAATLEYMNPQDCKLTGFSITANDGTSDTDGRNTGWVFGAFVITSITAAGKDITVAGTGFEPDGSTNATWTEDGAAIVPTTSTDTGMTYTTVNTGTLTLVGTNSDGETASSTVTVAAGSSIFSTHFEELFTSYGIN